MGYSLKCKDLKTRWDQNSLTCVPCPLKPGREITPNCGYDDDGGLHETSTTKCKPNTFNDGSRAYCQPCASCPPGFDIVSACNSTTETQCQEPRSGTTTETTSQGVSVFSTASTFQTNQGSDLTPNTTTIPIPGSDLVWAFPLAVLLSTIVVVLSACVIYMKRKRVQHRVLLHNRRSSYVKAGFSPLSAATGNNDLEGILSPNILSAPLQTVLDNLDVLEELVILLDPPNHGVKNTKHLASHCSFPSTWITYTYSLKDSKSPLKAVLEGVTSRHPDWTVGHLAKMLRHMERNDAIAVLAKLNDRGV
ncbi:IGF-like family receptor 1 [Siniperca chuatsi]|uniref:IGF-like family receptor 1 n=1 Tax=Siniperca chuatsi TaxID=119488 RepID=UPI001CE05388|nr:IGF-like family receptor 1 [Siniperca chuatsi]